MKLKAYTDGSYSTRKKDRVGAAYILLDENGKEVSRNFTYSTSPWLVEMRNVGGEILAAQMAIEDAYKRKPESLEVYHDYKGIGAWPDGEWEARKSQTKLYRDFVNKDIRPDMDVKFEWVQGHSGNKWNDLVDDLAKGAL